MTENEKRFLIGLEKLTRETGVTIGGCGCCGSPSLTPLLPGAADDSAGYGIGYAGEVTWLSPSDEYGWGNFRETIIKQNAEAIRGEKGTTK